MRASRDLGTKTFTSTKSRKNSNTDENEQNKFILVQCRLYYVAVFIKTE